MECKKCGKNQAVKRPKVENEQHYKDNELCENCLVSRELDIKGSMGLGGLFS